MKIHDRVILRSDKTQYGTLKKWSNDGRPVIAWDRDYGSTIFEREDLIVIGQVSPRIVCLCGSTRFGDLFQKYTFLETMAGKIVLSIGCNMKSDDVLFANYTKEDKELIKIKLDELHKRKIDCAHEVLVLNKDGYIGESTISEIRYALRLFKTIITIEPFNTNNFVDKMPELKMSGTIEQYKHDKV
jgi:hypothetical protein